MKPRIVVSGVNLVEAGPLAVFKDALQELANHFLDSYEVIALVHRKELFDLPGIEFREFPEIKASWLRRLRFEYFSCNGLSKELKPYLWLAMHDITPDVEAEVRAVYCHNPAPFYQLSWRDAMLDRTFALFHFLYRSLYKINISRNNFVVVQQQWLREAFERFYDVQGKVVVAHPSLPAHLPSPEDQAAAVAGTHNIFLYPVYPRFFKNVEMLLEAAELLEKGGAPSFELWLTMSGKENPYAANLQQRFGSLRSVRWLGFQPREEIETLYSVANCLVFPSKLETWGMPLSEFKRTGKQILVADMPYAHETIGTYGPVHFFSLNDPAALAEAMKAFLRGKLESPAAEATTVPQPFAPGWNALFRLLLRQSA